MTSPISKGAIRALFGMSNRQFHESFPYAPIVVHDRTDAAVELFDFSELRDVHSLLGAWQDGLEGVGLHPPGASDDWRSVLVPVEVARESVRSGCNLSFNQMERHIPRLVPWLDALRDELEVPLSTCSKCLGFFSSAGSGTVPHFDNRINISVQLYGTKRWQLAPNDHVEHPDFRYLIDGETQYLRGDRAELQTVTPLPRKMPTRGMLLATVKRGSIVFVPRGYWHATFAEEDSLSFNFWFEIRDWRHLVLEVIEDRLVSSPRWRALARGAGRSGRLGTRAKRELEKLLHNLKEDVGSITAHQVLSRDRRSPRAESARPKASGGKRNGPPRRRSGHGAS